MKTSTVLPDTVAHLIRQFPQQELFPPKGVTIPVWQANKAVVDAGFTNKTFDSYFFATDKCGTQFHLYIMKDGSWVTVDANGDRLVVVHHHLMDVEQIVLVTA